MQIIGRVIRYAVPHPAISGGGRTHSSVYWGLIPQLEQGAGWPLPRGRQLVTLAPEVEAGTNEKDKCLINV